MKTFRYSFFLLSLCTGLIACSESTTEAVDIIDSTDSELQQLAVEINKLEQEVIRVADINDIKRLQNSYGYYIDRSQWDDVVNLLTGDATAEYGLAGVYKGKEQISGLLYGIGYGEQGLQPLQLRDHSQLQPVITLSEDGMTAKGRWKGLVILGQFEEYARWQTGPYENEYRKENGVWKLSKLHWQETFTVPFEGGWSSRMEGTNVDDRIFPEADFPPSAPYEPWPEVSLLPYHFDNPVTGDQPLPETASTTSVMFTQEALEEKLLVIQSAAQRLEDEENIKTLQRTYGYFVDKNLWTEIGDLFAVDGTLEIGGRGIFVGRERAVEYLEWLGEPVQGRLYDHTQLQGIVHVSPDGKTAKGRWRALVFGGDEGGASVFGDCVYENEYVKVDGVWQISKLHAYFIMYSTMEQGWQNVGWVNTRPEASLPPDLPPTVVYDMYPGVITAPYHYENPVTGATGSSQQPIASNASSQSLEEMQSLASNLEDTIGKLGDAQQVERLQNIMGYYYDARQWDEIAALFAENGSMERDQRGVYIGSESIRRGLSLFGEPGLHAGNSHENYLYQNITHVSDDRQTANARLRTLNMHGDYNGEATLGGGVYENTYVKKDGVWKIQADHLYTTFIADYNIGWANGSLPVPGISESTPPDLPPSFEYETFPNYYIFPFHYEHPVTGAPIF